MDRFYQTMHSLDKVTYEELDRVLCRLTHNVKLCFFSNKNLKILLFFLLDNISTSFSQNASNFTS